MQGAALERYLPWLGFCSSMWASTMPSTRGSSHVRMPAVHILRKPARFSFCLVCCCRLQNAEGVKYYRKPFQFLSLGIMAYVGNDRALTQVGDSTAQGEDSTAWVFCFELSASAQQARPDMLAHPVCRYGTMKHCRHILLLGLRFCRNIHAETVSCCVSCFVCCRLRHLTLP